MEGSQSSENNDTILIVDDDRFFRSLIVNLLQPYNYHCLEAANGTIAIDMMRAHPSLIIVDFRLPDCDGLTLIGRIKEIKPDAPIVFLSGIRCDAGRLARLRAYNVSAVLEKPVDPVNFIGVVQEVLRQSKPAEAYVEQPIEDSPAELPAVDYNRLEDETEQPESIYEQEPAAPLLAITDRAMYNDAVQPQYFESQIDTADSAETQSSYPQYTDSQCQQAQPDSHPMDFRESQHNLSAEELRTIAESLAQFQREYLSALPNELISLSNRITSPDADTLNIDDIIRQAHTLKGTSGSYGMIEICHIAKRVEETAARHDLNELKTLSRALLSAAEDLERSCSPNQVKRQPIHSLNHVIVVHAHTGFRERIRTIASRLELDCTAAEDVIDATDCMQSQEVDAVIFGDAPGLEASVAELRRFMHASGKHALLVLAIGHATMSERILAVNQGFDLIIDGLFTERSFSCISQKAFPLVPKTALILGDETTNADAVAQVLSKAGTTVQIESDPLRLAFDSITQDGQIVIVARDAKTFSGFEVCRALLSCKESSSFSVILMDDEYDPKARRLAMSIGCDDYIFPPLTAQTLVTRLSRLASRENNAQHTFCNKKPTRKDPPRNRQCSLVFSAQPIATLAGSET